MHQVHITPIIGLPQFDGWSQVATNPSQSVVAAVAVSGLNAGNVGRDLLQEIKEFESQDPAAFHELLSRAIDDIKSKDCNLFFASLMLLEQGAIFATYQGSITLKRSGKVGTLLQSDAQLQLIQGKVMADDVIVLITQEASSFIGELQQKLGQGFDVDTTITSLVPGVHAASESSLSSLAFVVPVTKVSEMTTPTSVSTEDGDRGSQPVMTGPKTATISLLQNSADLLSELDTRGAREVSTARPSIAMAPPEIPTPVESPILQPESAVTTPPPSAVEPTEMPISTLPASSVPPVTEPQITPRELVPVGQSYGKKSAAGFKVVASKAASLGRALLRGIKRANFNPAHMGGSLGGGAGAVYVKRQSPRKILKIILPLIIIGVVIGAFITWRNTRNQDQVQAAQAVTAPLLLQLQAAQNQASAEPLPARSQMENLISQLEGAKTQFADQPAALAYIDQQLPLARQMYDQVSGRQELQTLPTFFDLRQVGSDFVGSLLDGDQERAIIADTEKGRVIQLNLSTREVTPVPPTAAVKDIAVVGNTAFVLGGGISRWNLDQNPITTTAIKEEGDSDRDGTHIGNFGTYVYIFNPAKRNIYRYPIDEDQLNDPIGWLIPGESLPYEQINSLSIDGDIWLTTREGGIIKMSSGQKAEFEVKGLAEPFSSAISLYTKENLQNVYILEPAKQRLVVLNKNGELVKEVKSPSLSGATQVIAHEAQNKAFALSGSLVFEIAL